jgi:hypothetical protein
MASIIGPNISGPMATVPPKATNHSDISRPRSRSSARLWKMVDIAVVVAK